MNRFEKNWLHPSSLEEARHVQEELASRVQVEDRFDRIQYVGGMDVSHKLYDPEQIIHAACVVLDSKNLSVLETAGATQKQTFPYIPGFLGFREAPALVSAFQSLKRKPDLIMVDGHGISHPRGLGIASHIGVLLDIPTIGVAKTILVGKPAGVLGEEMGSQLPLVWKGKEIATLLRSKSRCLPLIVSTGHRVRQRTALELVQKFLKNYRLPEPTRRAHLAANEYRKAYMSSSD